MDRSLLDAVSGSSKPVQPSHRSPGDRSTIAPNHSQYSAATVGRIPIPLIGILARGSKGG